MNRNKKTMDGNQAAAYVSYAYTEVATIYPITPSSPMPEYIDEWAVSGKKNIFGETVKVFELQSEAGAAGSFHGSLSAGALTTTFTASQGLLLMIPNIYKIAGEQLPGVIQVSARAIASHALSIFGDHSDVYACRQTGIVMLCEANVQEVMDLSPVAHCAAIEGKLPIMNFFDGFRTSHEIQKIEVWDDEDLKSFINMDKVREFRNKAMNPNHPCQFGSAQNPDIFFQAREACNGYYNNMPKIIQKYMDKINEKIGTNYKLFNYYGDKNAEHIIIAMGSVCDTIDETIDFLIKKGEKVGVVKVRLYRPFDKEGLINAIPDSVKIISVIDRTKEPGSIGGPLYLDVVAALKGSKFEKCNILSGRYGLGSKDTTPSCIVAIYKNKDKNNFTVGINDDVTYNSLKVEEVLTIPEGTINCKFWGLGSDGTVGANKNSIKIIGDNTDMYVQAYFDYDSKKSGGVTMSHLRFGKTPIKSTYLIKKANFVACHNQAYMNMYDIVQELVDGGIFLLNCTWDVNQLDENLKTEVKKYIADHNIQFYIINGVKIGEEIGIGKRINTILQSAFFSLINILPKDKVIELMKDAAKKTYSKKGEDIVKMNFDAIDKGACNVVKVDIPDSWKTLSYDEESFSKNINGRKEVVDFVNNIQKAINSQKGNDLPVSTFVKYSDGSTPSGTAAYEKRGIAVKVPKWDSSKCIQCNRCSYVCPHAVIRPYALTEEEEKNIPNVSNLKNVIGMDQYKFAMGISCYDCTGCGSCVEVCPVKALEMKPFDVMKDEQKNYDYLEKLDRKEDVINKFKENTVKGSQFKQPLLEFSGACAGCGETPYAKLITQLFGDRMYIANATGCSSIWGNSSPSTPYTVNKEGKGPAWSNSLFEDAAEYGYGMLLAQKVIRNRLKNNVLNILSKASEEDIKLVCKNYLDTFDDSNSNKKASDELIQKLEKCTCDDINKDEILSNKDYLSKKSQWIFGGDGWAYDIGFGGLDHVLASGEDINIMVFDTEVYSNTGGQASKSSQLGSVAKFAAGGKEIKKKDLASIAMSYGYVYVAQISMGADMNQTIKALTEAEAYKGPSLIIAYSPCINHGIKKGMGKSQLEEELAVKCGYWINFRYNPELKKENKSPFILDSKKPECDYKEFLNGEVRYNVLLRQNKEKADKLFDIAEKQSKEKYNYFDKLSKL